jgi:hypothetical protein
MAEGPKVVRFAKVLDEVMRPRTRWSCVNDSNKAEYKFINGEEIENLCSVCLSEALFETVTNSDDVISFSVMDGKKPIKLEITIL